MLDKKLKERRRAHRLTRKVIHFLRDNEDGWVIRLYPITGNAKLCRKLGFKTANIAGCLLDDRMMIIADPRSDVLSTIVHECLHALYPDAPELMVMAMEQTCVKHLTRGQAEEIFVYSALLIVATYDPEG